MSNIEPTEEQKQAAREICSRFAFSLIPTDVESLARLLAEREAKLREEVSTLNANNDQLVRALDEGGFCYPASSVPRFIVHNRLESSGDWYDPATSRILHMDPAKAFAMKDEIDALRARVAELENEVRIAWADCHDGSCEACAKCVDQAKHQRDFATARVAELEASEPNVLLQRAYSLACNERNAAQEREAQHLADIKALREALEQGYALSLNAREQVIKATAHCVCARLRKARQPMSEPIYPAGYECAHCHRLDSHDPRCPAYGQQAAVMPLLPVYSEDDVVELVRRTMVWCGHTETWASHHARDVFDHLKAGDR